VSRSLRILVGEDDSATVLGLEAELHDLGHTVAGVAHDGATAVAMARSLSPDLVLLDARMPHKSGLEAATLIHAERPVPIILITGFSDADTIAQAELAPVFHYLVKPVMPGQLGAAIAVAAARHADWLRERTERDGLRRRLEERKTIERAKGILMERRGLTEGDAYRMLRRTSQNRNVSMAELSRSLLDAEDLVSGGSMAASERTPVEGRARGEDDQLAPHRRSP